jgi:hypothetical protein
MTYWLHTNANRSMYFQPLIGSEAERRTRQGIVFLICLACLLLMLSSCALPVRVRYTDPEDAHRRLTGDVLTNGELSLASENTLRRYFLTQRFEDAPDDALVELHAAVRSGDENTLWHCQLLERLARRLSDMT